VVEYKLQNPALSFGLAAEADVKKRSFAAEQFGVNLAFGDF